MMKRVVPLILVLFLLSSSAHARSLSDIYKPLLDEGQIYSRTAFSYFTMREEGEHGSSSFGEFESEPDYPTLSQHFRFSPIDQWEIHLGYAKDFTADYERLTFKPNGFISFVNQYDIDFLHHYYFDLRRRFVDSEVFIESYGNQHKASWHSAPGFVEPDFFTVIRTHYENIHAGWRYLSPSDIRTKPSNLSELKGPLLRKGQLNIETKLEYKRGKVERANDFLGTTPATTRSYFHNLRAHFIPHFNFRYGLDDHLELTSGFNFEIPHRFQFEFQQFNASGTTNFIIANYKIEKKLEVPLSLAYRLNRNTLIRLSSDTVFAKQTLNGYEKELGDTITTFPEKKLRYLNTRPTINITYLMDAGQKNQSSTLNKLTKALLEEKQLLLEFTYQRDITHLRKNGANGAANILDAETIFRYPLDNFVAGTEYSAFLAGNSTLNTPDVHPQNFHQMELMIKYGLFQGFNTGVGVGYRSRSGVHQFTFADLASRQYQFEPYYFIDFLLDLQLTENSIVTFRLHHVPRYKTFLTTDIHPKQFEVTTDYTNTEVAFELLF